jgi:putative heme-binding domain-containing protein
VPPGRAIELPVAIPATTGLHDVYVVAVTKNANSGRKTVSLNWIEFQDSRALANAREASRASARKFLDAAKSAPKARPFVRAWTVDDLKADLETSSADLGRGERLFKELSCIQCHRFGVAGGKIGPDLTDVAMRMKKQPSPREALLVEIIEPSKVIDEKFRAYILTLNDGRQLAGIIVEQTKDAIRIAADPAHPDDVRSVPRQQIEQIQKSNISMMPVGLLNTLTREEIRDLLAFLEGKR